MRTAGIVLCGGHSSRMGRAKAWLPFGDELMLQRVVRVLREAVDSVTVVAAAGQDVPPLPPEVAIVRDESPGKGPLGGLAAGLAALAGTCDAVYLSSCDVPLLKPEFVRRVVSYLGIQQGAYAPRSPSIAVPRVNGFFHPLAAAYHVDVLQHVRAMIAANRLRMTDLLDLVPTRVIEAEEFVNTDAELSSLRNLNTPEEYEAALRLCGNPPSDIHEESV